VFASLGLTACSREPQAAAPAAAQQAKDKLTGDAAGTPADNPQCQLFTPAEVVKYIGEAVSPGQNAALGTGCQWLAADGTGDVIIAVVPSSYHEPPSEAPGYKAVPGVGTKGFVAPQLDGWVAGAVVGEDAIRVSVAGASAGEATAIQLLQDTIARRAAP
jgi:hypothetical protein